MLSLDASWNAYRHSFQLSQSSVSWAWLLTNDTLLAIETHG